VTKAIVPKNTLCFAVEDMDVESMRCGRLCTGWEGVRTNVEDVDGKCRCRVFRVGGYDRGKTVGQAARKGHGNVYILVVTEAVLENQGGTCIGWFRGIDVEKVTGAALMAIQVSWGDDSGRNAGCMETCDKVMASGSGDLEIANADGMVYMVASIAEGVVAVVRLITP
jgi:hypothetical protein